MKRTGPSNPILQDLIKDLKSLSFKEKAPIWKRIAEDLERPTRKRRSVNLYTIEAYVQKDETAVVPGKVLSLGDLTKGVTVAAFQFSEVAKEKLAISRPS